MIPIPFAPEPLARLRMRYAFATDHVHPPGIHPAREREHVFDFDDGLRLVVARERWPDGMVWLHACGEAEPGTPLSDRLGPGPLATNELLDIAESSYRDLSGDSRIPDQVLFSGGAKVPHWAFAESPPPHPRRSHR